MGVRVYKLDENLECRCGHKWGDHRKFEVSNKASLSHPLVLGGMIAGECEHGPEIAKYFEDKTQLCMCDNFRPQARNVQKIVDEWARKQEEIRKNGRQ